MGRCILQEKLNVAVIGVGYLGKFHAQKYAQLDSCELVAVVDYNREQAEQIAENCNTRAETDLTKLLPLVDAVSIAAPTKTHFDIAKQCLAAGVHVLVEKPITVETEEAETLITLAEENSCILQVGHLERFNTALRAVEPHIKNPMFIESHRLAPFNIRGSDVNVILDLMIHDIDIILSLVNSPVDKLDASGTPVISSGTDIANVRIQFENGCVANVTASRVSDKQERRMRFFGHHSCISVDFQDNLARIYHTGDKELYPGIPNIEREDLQQPKGDAILAEIEAFVHAIQTKTTPIVSGKDGLNALKIATDISKQLNNTEH